MKELIKGKIIAEEKQRQGVGIEDQQAVAGIKEILDKNSTERDNHEMIGISGTMMIEKITGITRIIETVKRMIEKTKEGITEEMTKEMTKEMTEEMIGEMTGETIRILVIIEKKKEVIEDREEEKDTMIKTIDLMK